MKLGRREFVEVLGSSAVSTVISPFVFGTSSLDTTETVERNGWQLKVAPTGDIISLQNGKVELINSRLGENHPRILILGKQYYVCNRPKLSRREGSKLIFQYYFSDHFTFSVDYEIALLPLKDGSANLRQKIKINAPTAIRERVKLVLPRNLQLPFSERKVFLPLKNGIGRRQPIGNLDNDDEYLFQLAGEFEGGKPQALAIPMVDEYADQTELHLTLSTDPYFSSYFTLPIGDKIGQFHCIYPRSVGIQGGEERVLSTGLHFGDTQKAVSVFCECSLEDVQRGPDWLHDVAMVDYDYLSKNGEGWFSDINKLEKLIPRAEREKVFLALHGWYDVLGRYSYDYRKRALDKVWVAFPSALDPDVQAYGEAPEEWTEHYWHKRSVDKMRPVEMSLAKMHRRIQFAKEKGFRVGLYFADGLCACTGAKDIYDPSKILTEGGWKGPDTKGTVYQQSPLHPAVRDFYKSYLQALISEYGKELDGLIWDETFYINPGELGAKAFPGYADRAMMTLVKELSTLTGNSNSQLAFLASDVIGVRGWNHKAPYSLVAHGTYQDSGCRPEAWPYGLFPNIRNVLWSCNWAPVTNFRFTQYAVETFDVPVAISNGPFGDDIGISEMNPQQLKWVMDLFEKRKEKRMQIGWIEENQCKPTYQGREIKYKASL
jgi:hypothetical protein